MVERETIYNEEFFTDDCYYVLYVTDVSRQIDSHYNPRTDDIIDEVLSEHSQEYSIYYRISNIKIDKGKGDIEEINYDLNFETSIFKEIAQKYIDTKYNLYPHKVDKNTESFELSLSYKGKEYLIKFQQTN